MVDLNRVTIEKHQELRIGKSVYVKQYFWSADIFTHLFRHLLFQKLPKTAVAALCCCFSAAIALFSEFPELFSLCLSHVEPLKSQLGKFRNQQTIRQRHPQFLETISLLAFAEGMCVCVCARWGIFQTGSLQLYLSLHFLLAKSLQVIQR